MPTTKPKTKDHIADIEAELELLQDRHTQATSGVEEARSRLDELATRRGAIASDAYFGDTKATEEIEGLDAESSNLVRVVALARDAAAALGADIQGAKERLAKERLAKERSRASSEQVAQLRQERQAVHEQALKAADELLAVLAEDQALHAKMVSAAQSGASVAGLENIARNHPRAELNRALAGKLRAYARDWV